MNNQHKLFLQARGVRYYPFEFGDHFYELQFYDSELSTEGVKRKQKLMAEIRDEFGIKPPRDRNPTDFLTPEEKDEQAEQVANQVLTEERAEDLSKKAKVLFVIGSIVSIGLVSLIFFIGKTHYQKQTLDQDLQDDNQAIQLDPDDAKGYINKGLNYQKQGEFEKALQNFNQAIQLNPDLAEAYSNRAVIYSKQGNFEKALQDANKAIQIDPDLAAAYGNRGAIYHEQGKLEKALQDYNRTIQLDPDDAKGYYNRGAIYDKQGNLEKALQNFDQAIQIDPEFAIAYTNRGVIYAKRKNREKAIQNLEKAATLFQKQGKTKRYKQVQQMLNKLR